MVAGFEILFPPSAPCYEPTNGPAGDTCFDGPEQQVEGSRAMKKKSSSKTATGEEEDRNKP